MKLLESVFNKRNNESVESITVGQVSQIPQTDRDIYVSLQKTTNLLAKIANEHDKYRAIQTIIDETPDGKQAYNTYVRLANQGVNIELYSMRTNRRVKKYDAECRDFCATLGVNNAEGLDGIIDQLHGSSVARGGMACEVVVAENATTIEDVLIIDPATFQEYKWIESEHRYAIYQRRDDGKKIDLYEGNFIWVPHQPKAGRPDGTLQFEPAIVTMTQFYQLLSDSMRILNRIGYPRLDVMINREALLNSIPAHLRANPKQQTEIYQNAFNEVRNNLRHIGMDSDIIHFDDNTISMLGAGVNGSGIDIRAWFEVLEPLIVNAFNMTPVLLGRLTTGSYSLGTVEFKIVTDTVDSMRRGSKRIIENIINIWARVHGYPVYAVCTHNPIDWEVQKEKLEVELLRMQKSRRAQEYGWISSDEAAMEGAGAERADNDDSNGLYEYLTHDMREQETVEEIAVEENVDSSGNGEVKKDEEEEKNT